MDVNFLLDQAKQACGVEFDKDLAPRLGVGKTSISNYRKGVSLPDPVVCATLAGLTGLPLAQVIGVVGEARAISTAEKAVWRRLAGTAMFLLISSLSWYAGCQEGKLIIEKVTGQPYRETALKTNGYQGSIAHSLYIM